MRKWIMGCALFTVLLLPNVVFAEEICVDGVLYDVVSKGKKVNLDEVTGANLRNKSTLPNEYFQMKQQFGVASPELKSTYGDVVESEYAIDATSKNFRCNRRVVNGKVSWSMCPTTSQYSGSKAMYSSKKFEEAVGEFEFEEATGRFYVTIKDDFKSSVMVRLVRNGKDNEEQYDYNSALLMGIIGEGESYELNSEGLRLYFQKEEDIRLEFYIRANSSGECAGAYLADITTSAPGYADVANPWKNSQICTNFKNGYNYISTSPTNYKAVLVPECYKDTIDYFTEKSSISEATINAKIQEVSKIFSGEMTSDIGQLQCHYHTDGSRETAGQTKSFVYNPSGSTSSGTTIVGDYWAASCTETVTVNYDQPKKVHAGTGFSYDATLTVTRKCTPFVLQQVIKPIQCAYRIECWGGPRHHTGQGGAGPNEDFDSCVNTCDGGAYSQECINACYSKVYEGKDVKIDLGLARGMHESFLDVIQARQVAVDNCDTRTPTSPNYCYTQKGWATSTGKRTGLGRLIYEVAALSNRQSNCAHQRCTSFHGITFNYKNICQEGSNRTSCYEVYNSKPRPECSDNPEEDYRVLLEASENEYKELLAAIRKYEASENFEMSVIDSYKTSSGRPLVTTSTSLANMVKVTGGVYTYPETNKTYKETPDVAIRVYSNVGASKSVPEVEVKKDYKIELPKAVVNQLDGKEKYVTNDYKKSANERDGGNKYYTDINSGTYNDYRKWYNNYSPLDERADTPFVGNNIGVVFKNIGTVQSNNNNGTASSYTWDAINLDCFYGLLNKRYIECDDGICDHGELVCDDEDVCTGGLQYMFRQINLTDMFPDRDPRWNWNYTTELDEYGYASRPKEVTKDTENLGNSAFSSENLDYEVTITKENIRSIRRYNKSQKNYQNYDMDCSVKGNGMEVCESKMLKDGSYVNKYSRNTELGSNN